MRYLKRLSAWSDDNPLISFLVGWIVLTVIVLTLLPADPPYVNQHVNRSAT